MPAKFVKPTLALNVEREEPPEQQHGSVMGSLRLNNDGITVLTSSYNPYCFSSEGMSKSNGQHYKISENDIYVIKRLGAGASGTVFKGFLYGENKFVAIKKINIYDKDTRHQMLNDVKALCDAQAVPGLISFDGAYHNPESGQEVKRRNLASCCLRASGLADDSLMQANCNMYSFNMYDACKISIVLEYMDGGSLADVLQKVGSIPENILSKITANILQGLNYLHKCKHMVHRDIKPANILLNLEGEPKITDFGISAFINSTLAVCNTFLGTVTYMSPERINNQQYSFPADIWSVGLALIECATGRYPYNTSTGPLQLMIEVCNDEVPVPLGPQFSDEFRDFVRQCMQKDPLHRPPVDVLLSHPFITKYEWDETADLQAFMQCVFDPYDKLDEVAVVFAMNYYALLSEGPDRLRDLAPLYSETSVMSHNGETAHGRHAIMDKLRSIAQMHSGFKLIHQVKHVDCQSLGEDGCALVHVQGVLVSAGLAGSAGAPTSFTEAFILSQSQPGEYFVANQVFRLHA